MKEHSLNKRSVARLSLYRDTLVRFKKYQVEWIFSEDIATAMGVTAAQVRKDFSYFRLSGRKKLGYQVDVLIDALTTILNAHVAHAVVIAGLSPWSDAFVRQCSQSPGSLTIAGLFHEDDSDIDSDPRFPGMPIHPLAALPRFVAENHIRLGVIACTPSRAQQTLDMMVMGGMTGVLNLSQVDVRAPRHCVVHTVNFFREFENILFFSTILSGRPPCSEPS